MQRTQFRPLLLRPHHPDDNHLQHWHPDCNRAGVLMQCTSFEIWHDMHHNKLCFTLNTCYCYSLLTIGNLEVLMHDCSPYVSQILRGSGLQQSKPCGLTLWHSPGISAATNDLVIQPPCNRGTGCGIQHADVGLKLMYMH